MFTYFTVARPVTPDSPPLWEHERHTFSRNIIHLTTSLLYKVVCTTLAILLTRGLEYVPLSHYSQLVFYTLAYLRNFIFPFVIITIIPQVCARIVTTQTVPKKAR